MTRPKLERKPEDATTNFSCLINIKELSDPFQALADGAGIDRTKYFRLMLEEEIKNPRILKKIKSEFKNVKLLKKLLRS